MQAMRERFEVVLEGALRFFPRDAKAGCGGERSLSVDLVVNAGDRQLERAASFETEEYDLRLRRLRQFHALRTGSVEDGEVSLLLKGEEHFLRIDVSINRAMPLDMVLCHHR